MPFGDIQMVAQGFNIRDEMPSSVVGRVGIRPRLATASLVEQNHSVFRRVKEDGVGLGAVSARPAVEVYDCTALAIVTQDARRTHQASRPSCQTAESRVHGYHPRAANPRPRHLRERSW
jgi:hypothetical protein